MPDHCLICCEALNGDLHQNPEHDEDHEVLPGYSESCEAEHDANGRYIEKGHSNG